jgi:hypothetical protein
VLGARETFLRLSFELICKLARRIHINHIGLPKRRWPVLTGKHLFLGDQLSNSSCEFLFQVFSTLLFELGLLAILIGSLLKLRNLLLQLGDKGMLGLVGEVQLLDFSLQPTSHNPYRSF